MAERRRPRKPEPEQPVPLAQDTPPRREEVVFETNGLEVLRDPDTHRVFIRVTDYHAGEVTLDRAFVDKVGSVLDSSDPGLSESLPEDLATAAGEQSAGANSEQSPQAAPAEAAQRSGDHRVMAIAVAALALAVAALLWRRK